MTTGLMNISSELPQLTDEYGLWIYIIFFAIVFLETGIVIFPFLPGDSLIFSAGAISNTGAFSVWALFVTFALGAIIGDTVNYFIGKFFGHHLTGEGKYSRFIEPEWIKKTEDFFERYGTFAIIAARFIPYVRTFAPFLAGMGRMHYRRFIIWNVIGAITWVSIFLYLGYNLGTLPIVKDNLSLLITAMVFIGICVVIYIIRRLYLVSKKNRCIVVETKADGTSETSGAIEACSVINADKDHKPKK